MKIKQFVLSFVTTALVACTAIGSIPVSAAQTNAGVDGLEVIGTANISDVEGTPAYYDTNKPTELYDWGEGTYSTYFEPMWADHHTYTRKKFYTKTGKLNVAFEFYSSGNKTKERVMRIKLYKGTKGWFGTTWSVDQETLISFDPSSNTHYQGTWNLTGLSADCEYYFEFCNETSCLAIDAIQRDNSVGCRPLTIELGN